MNGKMMPDKKAKKPDLLAEHVLENFRDLVLGWPLLSQSCVIKFLGDCANQRAQQQADLLNRDDWFLFKINHDKMFPDSSTGSSISLLGAGGGEAPLERQMNDRVRRIDGIAFARRSLGSLLTQSYTRSSHVHDHDDSTGSTIAVAKTSVSKLDGHDFPDPYRLTMIGILLRSLQKHPEIQKQLENPQFLQKTHDFRYRRDVDDHITKTHRKIRSMVQQSLPVLMGCFAVEQQQNQHKPMPPLAWLWQEAYQASLLNDVIVNNSQQNVQSHERPKITGLHWLAAWSRLQRPSI